MHWSLSFDPRVDRLHLGQEILEETEDILFEHDKLQLDLLDEVHCILPVLKFDHRLHLEDSFEQLLLRL